MTSPVHFFFADAKSAGRSHHDHDVTKLETLEFADFLLPSLQRAARRSESGPGRAFLFQNVIWRRALLVRLAWLGHTGQ